MHDARAIANEVLLRAWDEGLELTQIDIQKICYFLHGHHLRDHGQPLIQTEFEAWDHGPVQRVTYDAFKKFGAEPIDELSTGFDPVKRVPREIPRVTDNAAISTIETYLYLYLEVPSFGLVDMTHAPGTPWSKTIENARTKVNIGMRIGNDMILSHFEGLTPA